MKTANIPTFPSSSVSATQTELLKGGTGNKTFEGKIMGRRVGKVTVDPETARWRGKHSGLGLCASSLAQAQARWDTTFSNNCA